MIKVLFLIFLCLLNVLVKSWPDEAAMKALRASLRLPDDIDWSSSEYCTWAEVDCDENSRVISIRLSNRGVSGSLPPELKNLRTLRVFKVMDNQLAGIVPSGLTELQSLRVVALSRNLLQGPTPKFGRKVQVDMSPGSNSFCLDSPGTSCDPRVDALLSIAGGFSYPVEFANTWKGNDPCGNRIWYAITCDGGRITGFIMPFRQLTGFISPRIGDCTSLVAIVLSYNRISGIIPVELTKLKQLRILDLSHNQLHGKVPTVRKNIIVDTRGNPDIERNSFHVPSPTRFFGMRPIFFVVLTGILTVALLVTGTIAFYLLMKRKPSEKLTQSVQSPEIPQVEHKEIPMQILRDATNDFGDTNTLGRGGFGSVYKGQLQDGREIAVKKMKRSAGKGIDQFKSEVSVLTKVHHRNLVVLYGYCVEGDERLLVSQYMPHGTWSRHLFEWKDQGLRPLDWTTRLTVALDVARGIEYLHTLAHQCQSYIHRDLKPSNILLGEDLRAKVSDFGLARSTAEGRESIRTTCVGTVGYMAPELSWTERVTTKVDVYSFGVILMELITGQKAVDETRPEDDTHIVFWFMKMFREEDSFSMAIDETIKVNRETKRTIYKVSELAIQCCARKPVHRPDMARMVNVLSALIEQREIQDLDRNKFPQMLQKGKQVRVGGSSSGS